MTLLEGIHGGLALALSVETLPWLGLGAAFGLIVGVIPGLSGHFAMAMAVTFLYSMEPASGIVFILAAHATVAQGGVLTTILFSTPGTGQNAATLLDGPAMRDKGEAGLAVGAVMTSSFLGALFGAVALALLLPVLREVVLMFGPAEIFALSMLGLVFIAVLGRRDLLRSLIAGLIGLLLAMVGSGGAAWNPRLSFGIDRLMDGLPLVPVILGLFAVAEMFKPWGRGGTFAKENAQASSFLHAQTQMMRGALVALKHWSLVVRSSIIGTIIGLIPGLGSSTAAFIAYAHAKQTSPRPETFGTGNVEGAIAPETANNAVEGGALASTLAFGIPGSSSMAILLSAFTILGMQTGPVMLNEGVDVIYLMIFTIILGNLIGSVCGLFMIGPLVRLTALRTSLVVPWILVLIFTGAYAGERMLTDIGIALLFGVFGYIASLLRYSRAALLIGFVLGEAVDRNLNLGLQLEGPFFFLKGLALPLTAVTVLFLVWNLVRTGGAGSATGRTGVVSAEQSPDPEDRGNRLALETLFLGFLGVVAAVALVSVAGESWSTARTPVVVLLPLLALTAVQFLRVRRAALPGQTRQRTRSALAAEFPAFSRSLQLLGACLTALAAIAVLGHYVGVAALVFGLSGLLGGEWRRVALLSAVLAAATIYTIFEVCFGIDMYRGLVFRAFLGWRDF